MIGNAASWVGQVLGGRYEVTAALGSGGMAVLYRARDRKLNCDVAVKVPQAVLLQDDSFAKRFDHEIRALVQLSHPHIVKISDLGVHDGLPFAVLQFLSGGTLRTRQRPAVPMRPEELRGWLADVAAALDFIHKQGFVHRDIKPENILFDGAGHVYLADFGIAKVLYDQPGQRQKTALTTLGSTPGTPQYMAPELIVGQKCDGRADQYGLAVTVYELLGGRVPFDGATPTAVYEQQKTAPVPLDVLLPSVPKGLAQAVQQALMREPGKRYKDCAAFAKAVMQAVAKGGSRGPALAVKETPPVNQTVVQWISVSCPGCRKTERVAATAQGTEIKCPSCKRMILVPSAAQAAKTQKQSIAAATEMRKRPGPNSRSTPVPDKRGSRTLLLVGGALMTFLLAGLVVGWQTIGEGKVPEWFTSEAKKDEKDGKGLLAQIDEGKGKKEKDDSGLMPKSIGKDKVGLKDEEKKRNVEIFEKQRAEVLLEIEKKEAESKKALEESNARIDKVIRQIETEGKQQNDERKRLLDQLDKLQRENDKWKRESGKSLDKFKERLREADTQLSSIKLMIEMLEDVKKERVPLLIEEVHRVAREQAKTDPKRANEFAEKAISFIRQHPDLDSVARQGFLGGLKKLQNEIELKR